MSLCRETPGREEQVESALSSSSAVARGPGNAATRDALGLDGAAPPQIAADDWVSLPGDLFRPRRHMANVRHGDVIVLSTQVAASILRIPDATCSGKHCLGAIEAAWRLKS